MYLTSISIAILGLVVYQLSMRTAPHGVNPWWLLTMAYLLAAAICVPAGFVWRQLMPATPPEIGVTTGHFIPALFIAVSVILIEIGYLLVYRAGWPVSVAPAVAQAVTLTVMLGVGAILFREKVTLANLAGLALCVGGILLIVRKG